MNAAPPSGGRPPVQPIEHELPLPPDELMLVTPASRPSALAILDMDQRLRLLHFQGAGMGVIDVDEDYIGQVAGGELSAISPAPHSDRCAYLQTRRLIVYDIGARSHVAHRLSPDLEECGVRARWSTCDARAVIVQMRDTGRFEDGLVGMRLRSFALDSGGSPTGVLELGDEDGDFKWDAGNGIVAVVKDGAFEVRDPDLQAPQVHPLTQAVGPLVRARGRVLALRLHHRREMAILALAERDQDNRPFISLLRATWGAGAPMLVQVGLLQDVREIALDDVSPDGDWLAYRIRAHRKTRVFIQKIGEPHGAPIELGSVPGVRAVAWTQDPLALVVIEAHSWRILHFGLDPMLRP